MNSFSLKDKIKNYKNTMTQKIKSTKVEYTGKHLLLNVYHNGVLYECVVSSDCKDLFKCNPAPNNWIEIEDIIRDAAFNLNIKNLDE